MKTDNIELQILDSNCNDCKFMNRDFEKYKSFDNLHRNSKGQVVNANRLHYGYCKNLNKNVSFLPNICQIETQNCFKHRKL